MERPIGLNKPFCKVFKPIFLEHASHSGMTFNTEPELRAWCKKEGVESSALL